MPLPFNRVHPVNCTCPDCRVGYAKPLDDLSLEELVRLLNGQLVNQTNYDVESDFVVIRRGTQGSVTAVIMPWHVAQFWGAVEALPSEA